jgi:hypothetical protein
MSLYKVSRLVLGVAIMYLLQPTAVRASSSCYAYLNACGSAPTDDECYSGCQSVAHGSCQSACLNDCGHNWYGFSSAYCYEHDYRPFGPDFYESDSLICACES